MAGPGPFALAGRVVTMAPGAQPLTHGVVYVKDDSIVDVRDASAPAAQPPPGFEAVTPIDTKGTIYPGLDRAPQPPELRRPAAVGRAQAVHEPRPVVQREDERHVPQAHQRPDADRRDDAGPARGGSPLRRGEVPPRRDDHVAGHRPLLRRRHPQALLRGLPERRGDQGQGPARTPRPGSPTSTPATRRSSSPARRP